MAEKQPHQPHSAISVVDSAYGTLHLAASATDASVPFSNAGGFAPREPEDPTHQEESDDEASGEPRTESLNESTRPQGLNQDILVGAISAIPLRLSPAPSPSPRISPVLSRSNTPERSRNSSPIPSGGRQNSNYLQRDSLDESTRPGDVGAEGNTLDSPNVMYKSMPLPLNEQLEVPPESEDDAILKQFSNAMQDVRSDIADPAGRSPVPSPRQSVAITAHSTPEQSLGDVARHSDHEDFSDLDIRQETFSEMEIKLKISRSDLAEAGFYYRGVVPSLRCYSCRGEINLNLNRDTFGSDSWSLHARYFPKCSLLLTVKGGNFVRREQQRLRNGKQTTPEEDKNLQTKPGEDDNFQLEFSDIDMGDGDADRAGNVSIPLTAGTAAEPETETTGTTAAGIAAQAPGTQEVVLPLSLHTQQSFAGLRSAESSVLRSSIVSTSRDVNQPANNNELSFSPTAASSLDTDKMKYLESENERAWNVVKVLEQKIDQLTERGKDWESRMDHTEQELNTLSGNWQETSLKAETTAQEVNINKQRLCDVDECLRKSKADREALHDKAEDLDSSHQRTSADVTTLMSSHNSMATLQHSTSRELADLKKDQTATIKSVVSGRQTTKNLVLKFEEHAEHSERRGNELNRNVNAQSNQISDLQNKRAVDNQAIKELERNQKVSRRKHAWSAQVHKGTRDNQNGLRNDVGNLQRAQSAAATRVGQSEQAMAANYEELDRRVTQSENGINGLIALFEGQATSFAQGNSRLSGVERGVATLRRDLHEENRQFPGMLDEQPVDQEPDRPRHPANPDSDDEEVDPLPDHPN